MKPFNRVAKLPLVIEIRQGVAGARGILYDPKGTAVATFAWGLGTTSQKSTLY
jgi:hypothetical protein